jgi:hypothetical protein
MSPTVSERSVKAIKCLKHPMVVLIVGTALGSVVIPYLNARIDNQRRLAELKSQRAALVLQSAGEVDRLLNLLLTEFGTFRKDQIATNSATPAAKEALRTRVYDVYREFDRRAWWWHWQTLEEAPVLNLVTDEGFAKLDAGVRCYHQALLASAGALDPLWSEFIRKKSNTYSTNAKEMVEEAALTLRKQTNQRRGCVRQMVRALLDN